jgi:pseudouridine-5'-phosphate glycosidase
MERLSLVAGHLEPARVVAAQGSGVVPLSLAPEVSAALRNGEPVVALESTIVSHGMPWPQNFHTAQEVEKIVRDNGAVPATIALMDGVVKVGAGRARVREC